MAFPFASTATRGAAPARYASKSIATGTPQRRVVKLHVNGAPRCPPAVDAIPVPSVTVYVVSTSSKRDGVNDAVAPVTPSAPATAVAPAFTPNDVAVTVGALRV